MVATCSVLTREFKHGGQISSMLLEWAIELGISTTVAMYLSVNIGELYGQDNHEE